MEATELGTFSNTTVNNNNNNIINHRNHNNGDMDSFPGISSSVNSTMSGSSVQFDGPGPGPAASDSPTPHTNGSSNCVDNQGSRAANHGHHHNIVPLQDLEGTSSLTCATLNGTSPTCGGVGGGGGGVSQGGGDGSGGSDTIVCPNHARNELRYFCSHCDTAVCETCTQVSDGFATLMLMASY